MQNTNILSLEHTSALADGQATPQAAEVDSCQFLFYNKKRSRFGMRN